ncbi:hypothetical protein ACHWQZ_G014437 [Mnemiopsis leidyi]
MMFIGHLASLLLVSAVFSANIELSPWKPKHEMKLSKVATGKLGIWALDSQDKIFFRKGEVWEEYPGRLSDISVGGNEIWGVNSASQIWKRTASTSWVRIPGGLKQVSVSDKDHVWGVNSGDHIYRRTGDAWQQVSGRLKVVSVGQSGVWGVNSNDDIFYRTGTYGDPDTQGTGWQHIGGKLKWISSGLDIVFGVNSNDHIYYRAGISPSTPAGTNWVGVPGKLSQVDTHGDVVVGANSAQDSFSLTITQTPGKQQMGSWSHMNSAPRFTRVSTGEAGVWAVNSNHHIHYRSGEGWIKYPGGLVDISVGGSEIWGVNSAHLIYRKIGSGNWANINGKLKQISVSKNDHVWGVNSGDYIYRRTGNSWQQVSGRLKVVSVGQSGVWGVNSNDDIFYRTGTYGDPDTQGTGWEHIPGKLKWISAGQHVVFGVNSNDDIFYREGMSRSTPTGSRWVKVGGKLAQIDTVDNNVWGVNTAGDAFSLDITRSSVKKELPSWPEDFKWSFAGVPAGYSCTRILELAEPAAHTWGDNYFCWKNDKADPGLRWSMAGPIAGQRCTRILETADPHTWGDNYLCVPPDSPYHFQWSSAGPVGGKECIQWLEPADPHTWSDNFLCNNRYKDSTEKELSLSNWSRKNAPALSLKSVASGKAGILAVSGDDKIFVRNGEGWQEYPGTLMDISVGGNDIWGVNRQFQIWKRTTSTSWVRIPGGLKQVSVSDKDHVWGVNSGDNIYRRTGDSWQQVSGRLKVVSVGQSGVWGVNSNDDIFYRTGTYGDPDTQGTGWEHIGGKLKWISSGHNIVVGVNSNDDIFFRHGISPQAPAGTGWTKIGGKLSQVDTYGQTVVGSNSGLNVYLLTFTETAKAAQLSAWRDENDRLSRIAHGKAGTWALDNTDKIYFSTEERWQEYPGRLSDISVGGNEIWGVNRASQIWKRTASTSWVRIPGGLKQVSVSDKDHVWGVNSGDYIYRRTGDSWQQVSGRLKVVSVGQSGVWGVNSNDDIFYRTGTYGDPDTQGTAWNHIAGKLKWISSGKSIVFGVNSVDDIFYRAGISESVPIGTHWVQVPGKLSQIDTYEDFVWGVNSAQKAFFLTLDHCEDDVSWISVGQTTEQSSTGWSGDSARAVDGNIDGQYSHNSCSCTAADKGNWWRVNFKSNFAISHVIIHNRQDCCEDRINGAMVYAGDVYCGTVKYTAGQTNFKVECEGLVADHVLIRQPYTYLTLCEVQVFGKESTDEPMRNIGQNKPATQSSVGWGGEANRATDNRVDGRWGEKTCTHTLNTNILEWWTLDLKREHFVDRVVLYNRQDCCSERLNGAKVYVDEELCGAITVASGVLVYPVSCKKRGNFVKVRTPRQYLTLCEVEVIGYEDDDLENIAANGRATQDSTGWNGKADRAIDGNEAGDYWQGSCSHNGDLEDGWWNLDIESAKVIDHVEIHNREDCCQERLNGVKVYVDDNLCGTVNYEQGLGVYKIYCDTEGIAGRNVRILAAPRQYLTLCEVKVMSDPKKDADDFLVNLALKKPTRQSSTGWEGLSARAVDGNIDSHYWGLSCTHTAGAGWWSVDLLNFYHIKKIVLYNRADCCAERLHGAKVYAGDRLCGVVEIQARQNEYTIECDTIASQVKVVNSVTHLTLCEVRVIGLPDPIDEGEDKVVDGDTSEEGDDKKSIVRCPAGYTIKSCTIIVGNVPDRTDGLLVNHDGSGTCTGFNSYKGNGVKARGVCTLAVDETNPCNGPRIPVQTYARHSATAPMSRCQGGYEMIGCLYHSWWSPGISDAAKKKVSHSGQVSFSENTCALPDCGVKHCTTTGICQLTDLEQYVASNCPDCKGYHCGDQEECVMEDGKPICKAVQTGCDNNKKCGTYGECEPVGSNDYTCICQEGYQLHTDRSKNVKTCVVKNTVWTIVVGETISAAEATSTAECPQGLKIMRCMTYGVPTASDGVVIENSGSSCVARRSRKSAHSIQAIAYCGPLTIAKDPCSEVVIGNYEYRYQSDQNPSLECPKGYVPNSCNIYSPWMESATSQARSKIDSIGSIKLDGGICSVADCTNEPGSWCRLAIICQKLTGDEYIKRACPTCEEMRCDDDEECTIGQNGLPQCSQIIPGACEELPTRCGEGQCIEVNETDFKCVCNNGYHFDGTTCIDVDECVGLPCGNGECINMPGSYRCECLAGYELIDGRCADIDECETATPCNPELYVCSNIEGGYTCNCHEAFIEDEEGNCHCDSGFIPKNKQCIDVNECTTENACAVTEDCENTPGGYRCLCKSGFVKDAETGTCISEELWSDCNIEPKPSHVKAVKGSSFTIWLSGINRAIFRKHGTIKWLKDGTNYDPATDGKDIMVRGFEINAFKPEDAGVYDAHVTLESKERKEKCNATVVVEMIEGSATVRIANRKELSKDKESGQSFWIKCDLKLINIELPDQSDPNNVEWYKMTPGKDPEKLSEETHGEKFEFNKRKGTYRLRFTDPSASDSGTYRCKFNDYGIETSTDVTLKIF